MRVEVASSAEAETDAGTAEADIDDSEVIVDAELTKHMAAEVAAYTRSLQKRLTRGTAVEVDGAYNCELCPFRSFDRKSRLVDHVKRYHDAKCQFVCSGTKQLKAL
jgi:hypothetical protein